MLVNITFFQILVVGAIATIFTDVYELALERFWGKTRDWHLVGRWMYNIPLGSFVIDPSDESGAVSGELAMGWIFHYVVGILFATIYLLGVHFIFREHPSIGNAIGFGVITVAAPWLFLLPGLGLGFFAAKTERPNFVRITSLSIQMVFGVGLYFGALITGLTG